EITDTGISIIPGSRDEEDEVLYKEDLIGNIHSLSSKLNIFENTGNIYYLKQLAPALIVLVISYGLFVTGESFQYMKYSNILNSVRSDLQTIYSNAGVADTADPYGMLLYKAKGSPNEAKTLISNILEKLSQSVPDSTTLISMNYKTGELKINGEAKDLKTLEDIEGNLSSNLDKSAQIINTNKDGEIIKFSIRVSL
ncbi:PilN domain-containing protein, partial [Flexistipes sinusarabici]|uniref:PilN domain-containing protein n=1 Tax=Flexistipes sinusarabici TaxID=2352 RepID=UPI0026EE3BB6